MIALSLPGPFESIFLLAILAGIVGVVLWAVRRKGQTDRGFDVMRNDRDR